ncbi:cell division protein SepF [Cryobacterium tepidiphilum]|uniref:Cell division protein SepF n=1 Tax=Cryobacterium tepidiphilum TaxID=2486026 RepID=A0A3M8L3Z9_9MICO|nr:cell division protein SepF [Cryobacterium tepidiphilum]RNE59452.1 DUF552 domain-containing protein [Cryobacterium tepidiphilum]
MSNPLKKTMVYLGLADEELEYEAHAAPGAAAAPERSFPERATNSSARTNSQPAPVTPLHRVATPRNVAASEMNEILTVHPRQYRDAQAIAESFRDGIPVIINLSQMSDGDARRLIDFASGLSQGLSGKIERVTAKVFLLSPSHVAISGESAEGDSDSEASFFGQS